MSALGRDNRSPETDDDLPAIEDVVERFAARAKGPPLPWLTAEALAAAAALVEQGVPEISGPLDMRIPDAED